MRAAIEASGYLLEGRIGRVLQDRSFFVESNGFRVDPNDPNKKIELDVHGRYFEWINENDKSTATVSLLVECKNNAQPFAFFVQPQQLTEINDCRIHYGGFPSFSMDPDTKIREPLCKLLGMNEWHHYCHVSEVATQFCGFTRPNEKKKWKADPMGQYSSSFSNVAVLAAVDAEGAFGLQLQNIQVQLAYPVVVFQGPIYRVRDERGKATVEEVTHVHLHHSATLNGRMIQAQIDVVSEKAFPSLVEIILTELKTFKERINALYPRLLNSALDQKSVAIQRSARQMFKDYMGPGAAHSL
jgi:hypothetical protein